MMCENEQNMEEQDLPPNLLFDRLSHLSGYTWDQSIEPFHSVRHQPPIQREEVGVHSTKYATRATIIGMSLVFSMQIQRRIAARPCRLLGQLPRQHLLEVLLDRLLAITITAVRC